MSEYTSVQRPLLTYAQAIGWEYVPPATALKWREGEAGRFFVNVLAARLLALNPGVLDHARAAEVARELRLLPATIAGNRDALEWLRGERSVYVPGERRQRNVRLVDFDRPDRNVYHVTEEWVQKGAAARNRADAVFLINGIPVAVAELKAPTVSNAIAAGVEQIRRYHRETPDLLALPQLFEVTHLLDFYYGATWSTSRKALFNWKEDAPATDGADNFEAKVRGFFDRPRFLKTLRDYVVFLTNDDELTRIVLRQHQTRAVEKVLDRLADPTKRRGLVWHTQGSGKTYTMLTVASRLLRDIPPGSEKPTVLMLVDRNELEAQLFRHIKAYGLSVEVANSKRELRDLLAADTRGLIVSMVHKFDDVPADLNTRAGITVLVDEAHRTTGGDLGNYLLAALPNATYIGFTGTPIQRISRGEGTFKVFGGDDAPQGYLDKYSIRESVDDGTTVPLNYALAPSALRVDRDTLEREFLSLARAEGLSDLEELNAVLDRAVELKELMKAPDRVDKIAQLVATHYRENVEPMGFKAFLVGVDRQACVLYKDALDRYLPPEWSTVVYSPAHNDSAALKRWYLDEAAEKKTRKAFTEKDGLPKILIVTEKLLTGFDAPILYAMYLDKPMRDHVLLQAIARVNRPYEDESGQVKPYGFVLDFVGIFENLQAALAFDSDVVESVIQNLDVLRHLFAAQMANDAQPYLPYARGRDDKAKEEAVARFADKAERETFFAFAKRLQNLYEILSPDASLRPSIEDYTALQALYALVRAAYSETPYVDRDLTAKTRGLLRERITTEALALPGAIHTLGAEELAMLRASETSDGTKVLNLRKILADTVRRDAGQKPFAQTIGERVEELVARYEEGQTTTQAVLDAFVQLALDYVEADAERERLGMGENAFAIYRELHNIAPTITTAQAEAVDTLFLAHPEYRWNETQGNQLRAKLYGAVRPLVGRERMVAVANALLRLNRL